MKENHSCHTNQIMTEREREEKKDLKVINQNALILGIQQKLVNILNKQSNQALNQT